MLRQIGQLQKAAYCMAPSLRNVQNRGLYGDGKSISGCLGLGVVGGVGAGDGEVGAKGLGVSF